MDRTPSCQRSYCHRLHDWGDRPHGPVMQDVVERRRGSAFAEDQHDLRMFFQVFTWIRTGYFFIRGSAVRTGTPARKHHWSDQLAGHDPDQLSGEGAVSVWTTCRPGLCAHKSRKRLRFFLKKERVAQSVFRPCCYVSGNRLTAFIHSPVWSARHPDFWWFLKAPSGSAAL